MAQSVWDDWGVLPSAFHPMYTIPTKEEAMKVQRKVSPHREWDVVEQSRSFYIVSDGSPNGEGLHYTLSKAEYEPVEEWVDVTHECNMLLIGETYRVYHAGTWIGDPDKYRVSNATLLSKVKVEVKR